MKPQPPFLVVREKLAFWTDHQPLEAFAANLTGIREGFESIRFYDLDSGAWPVTGFTLKAQPSFLHRIMPWRTIPIALHFGPREEVDLSTIILQLKAVLESDSEFCEYVRPTPKDVLKRFESVKNLREAIQIAEQCVA